MDDEEYLLDEISGRKRKPVMAMLNKKKITRFEMDELFLEE